MAVLSQEEQERAVGITAFVSPDTLGFTCIVKQRYTDFLVNEILPGGEVLHLTQEKAKQDQGARIDVKSSNASATPTEADDAGFDGKRKREDDAEPIELTKRIKTEEEKDGEQVEELQYSIADEDKAQLLDIFGESVTDRILDLWRRVNSHRDRKARDHPTVRSDLISEKSKRTDAHMAIRRIFNSKLRTEMLQDEPGIIAIRAAPPQNQQKGRDQQNGASGPVMKGKQGWDDLGGEYLHFTLYKENKDTMEVLYFIASQLKVKISIFEFAGTKDRRGVTVQRVCAYRIHANRIKGLMKIAKAWRAGGFEYRKHGLDLGELAGNEFLLTLRDCNFAGGDAAGNRKLEHAQTVAADIGAKFKHRGFINYYGLQRFGAFSTGTHTVGMKMLKGDLEGAVDSILTYSPEMLPESQYETGDNKVPQDDISRADAIRAWRASGDSAEALSKMPKRFQAEYNIIQYLSKKERKTGKLMQERDWQGALMTIQRNLRLMYVHAYQSLVWNTVASKRWEMHGDKVVEGDLVIIGEKDGPQAMTGQDDVDEDGEPVFQPAAHDTATSADEKLTQARPLSKEEAESGRYSVFDIVLPLPGFGIVYPSNDLAKFYEEFMASEAGGGLDPYDMRRSWKDISLFGDYRKMMARPGKDFAMEVRSYTHDEEQMVQTDLERLQKQANCEAAEVANGARVDANNGDGSSDAQKIAVVLKMQLGSSQYATMALRELTKGGAMAYKPEFSATR